MNKLELSQALKENLKATWIKEKRTKFRKQGLKSLSMELEVSPDLIYAFWKEVQNEVRMANNFDPILPRNKEQLRSVKVVAKEIIKSDTAPTPIELYSENPPTKQLFIDASGTKLSNEQALSLIGSVPFTVEQVTMIKFNRKVA